MIILEGSASECGFRGPAMSRYVVIGLILLAVVVAAGLIVPAVYRARSEEEMRRCQNHLRMVGFVGMFHATMPGEPMPTEAQAFFPAATIANADLTYDHRLSWYPLIIPGAELGAADAGGQRKKSTPVVDLLGTIDVKKPWDAPENWPLAKTRLVFALCPAQVPTVGAEEAALTNYLGNGGLGAETPALDLEAAGAKAGVFRYDTRTPLEAIRDGDGLANTISVIESAKDIGPWLRGGPATVRCLTDDLPRLGPGAPYAGCHVGRGNFAFADGSVRVLTDRTNPVFFRALLTIRGGEKEQDFNDH
jgi:prepilin-type processing-associated H-X9-DG protein